MLSPGRLSTASSVAHYSTSSPNRMPNKATNLPGNLSPRPAAGPTSVSGTGSAASSASSAQARAQAPPALTPRQLNVGTFVPQAQVPFRAPSPGVGSLSASGSSSWPPVSPPRLPPRTQSPTPLLAEGSVPETSSGGSLSTQNKRVISVHGGAGGSFELPACSVSTASFVPRSQSTSPSHRPRSPGPQMAMAQGSQVGLQPGPQVATPSVRTGTPGRLGFRMASGAPAATVT